MRVFVGPRGSLEEALEVLRRTIPRSFPAGAIVDEEEIVLVDLRDLERALNALKQTGIKAVPEFSMRSAIHSSLNLLTSVDVFGESREGRALPQLVDKKDA